jgi:t-SNARE complex subunit (syntaxin)
MIKRLPESLKLIDSLIDSLSSAELQDLSLKSKVREQINIIKEKLNPKKKEVNQMLNKIVEKETKFTQRLSISSENFDSVNSMNDSQERRINGSFRESKLFVQDLQDNSEYIRKRQEELEDIKKISSQVRDITNVMRSEVDTQGKNLKSIEENVTQTKDNVIKAEFEISQAEKTTRSTYKRTCCLFWIVLFIIVSIIAIILVIVTGGESKKIL